MLIIFSVFLIHKGNRKYSNLMLLIYFSSQIIVVGLNTFIPTLYVSTILYPVIFTWGALFFIYLSSLFNQSFRLTTKHIIHLYLPWLFWSI
ncbi:MAG: hypothetical protein HC906_19790 [Bacteroidales bacterium]|nr:hypothetical protein [Bacteroidales bacterium]